MGGPCAVVKLHRKDEPIDASEWSEDSDWEDEMEQAGESAPEERADAREETKQEPLPVLKIGSPARYVRHAVAVGQVSLIFPGSWKCLSFYLCTNTIQFAPLKSQGAKARTQHSQDHRMMLGERPPICSPKTIYCIATAVSPSSHARHFSTPCFSQPFLQLGMETLRRLASNDIRSKVTSTNVITEVFSNFTSRCVPSSTRTVVTNNTQNQRQATRDQRNAM